MKQFPPNLNRSPTAWNLPTLIINAYQIVTNTLSAITANIGNLIIEVGGSLSSGETSYGVGHGFWLGTDSSGNPNFSLQDTEGNFINIAASGTNVLAISSSGLINALTSKQIDDQGWKNTAVWLDLIGTPTTRAGYGITDAQATLPNATGVGQVLQRDNSGNPYFSVKYGSEVCTGAIVLPRTGLTSSSYIQIGNTLGIPNPGTINFFCIFTGEADTNTGTEFLDLDLQYSKDGGSTWTDLQVFSGATAFAITSNASNLSISGAKTAVACTGDLQFRLRGANASAVNTINIDGNLSVLLIPNNSFYSVTGALSVSIPATGAGNCVATYPATTCTASVNVTAAPSGGTPPYAYLWSVVSGTGTITAGSTSQTCTVSDTETATTGGATFNTTVHCKVTDSVPNNVTSLNDVITNTFTLVYAPITATVSPTNGSCSTNICAQSCQAQGFATANPSGGNGSYTYSWSVASGPGSITAGSTSQTCTVSETHATAPGPHIDNTTVQCSVNDTRSTGAVTPQGTVSLTFSCPQH